MISNKKRNRAFVKRMLIGVPLLAGILCACNENNDPSDDVYAGRPDIPQNLSIDIDADNQPDFLIEYEELATMDVPSSGGSIIGSICPVNDYELIYKSDEGHLFFEENDTIKRNRQEDYLWESFPADLVSINRLDQHWDKHWKVLSESETDYFLAFQKTVENNSHIGWLKLEIDTLSGTISLIDKMISESEELIIKK